MSISTGFKRSHALTARAAAALIPLAGLLATQVALAAEETGGIEEVIVTAQFREQNLQVTPLPITAVTGDMLERRSQTDIADVAPGAECHAGGAKPEAPPVPSRTSAASDRTTPTSHRTGCRHLRRRRLSSELTGSLLDLMDVDRVEILRGPQGTLAGRNSIGGAIKMYSVKPQGDGSGSCPDDLRYAQPCSTSVPVGDFAMIKDTLFMRRVGRVAQAGWLRDPQGLRLRVPGQRVRRTEQYDPGRLHPGTRGRQGLQRRAHRASACWHPTTYEINLSGDLTLDNSPVAANVLIGTAPVFQSPSRHRTGGRGAPSTCPRTSTPATHHSFGYRPSVMAHGGGFEKKLDYSLLVKPFTKTKVWGTNLTVDWKLGQPAWR